MYEHSTHILFFVKKHVIQVKRNEYFSSLQLIIVVLLVMGHDMKMTLGIKLALAGGLMESFLYCSGVAAAAADDTILEFKRELVHLSCSIMMKLCKHEYQI